MLKNKIKKSHALDENAHIDRYSGIWDFMQRMCLESQNLDLYSYFPNLNNFYLCTEMHTDLEVFDEEGRHNEAEHQRAQNHRIAELQ